MPGIALRSGGRFGSYELTLGPELVPEFAETTRDDGRHVRGGIGHPW